MKEKDPKSRKLGLGRGLSALLSGEEDGPEGLPTGEQALPTRIDDIPIGQIETNPYQPRVEFAQEQLEELAESIRTQGIIQPITVRMLAPGQYQLISGERRLRASKLAGLETVPAYIRTANDEQLLEWALIENIQREDLNPVEVALAYKRLTDELGIVMEELGERVGKKRATVNNYLRLLKLPPEIQRALQQEVLGMGHARALITVEDPALQLGLFKEIVAKGLSVRQVEELVRKQQPEKAKAPKAKTGHSPFEVQVADITRRLERHYATKVKLEATPQGKGTLRFEFYSHDDLNRLLELLDISE
ncbi:MAG: ParB/RepB/Spo0J family partition protein [Bacteroidia bacterium]|nr:ParB/RepB/Spo0J family partition protein [Bacteroidia bacterium]